MCTHVRAHTCTHAHTRRVLNQAAAGLTGQQRRQRQKERASEPEAPGRVGGGGGERPGSLDAQGAARRVEECREHLAPTRGELATCTFLGSWDTRSPEARRPAAAWVTGTWCSVATSPHPHPCSRPAAPSQERRGPQLLREHRARDHPRPLQWAPRGQEDCRPDRQSNRCPHACPAHVWTERYVDCRRGSSSCRVDAGQGGGAHDG